MADPRLDRIRATLGYCPGFPKPGVIYRDIFPVLRNPAIFNDLNDVIEKTVRETCPKVQVIIGLDSRGFLFGPILAQRLNIPFVPIRKKGKLPGEIESVTYELEYGSDQFEIQKDAIKPGQEVVILDDLLATGGTMRAACELVERLKGEVRLCFVVTELAALKGREKLTKPVKSLIVFTD